MLQAIADAKRSGSEDQLCGNADLFRNVTIIGGESPREQGGFSIVAPAFDDHGELAGIRFGLEDESNRINLNLLKALADTPGDADQEMLMALSGMTVEIADAILDWLDSDDSPRPAGVESNYYATLNPPYAAANRELTSIAELLLVRGVTPQLLFGQDLNQNHLIEGNEARASAPLNSGGLDGVYRYGWATHLTLYSRDRDGGGGGAGHAQPIDINQEDLPRLYGELLEQFNKQTAMFIVAYRQQGPFAGPAVLESASARELDLTQPARCAISHPLDLIGQNVQMTLVGDVEPVAVASPFKDDESELHYNLGELERLSIPKLPVRINIMGAPRVVLRSIPGIDDTTVEAILNHRDAVSEREPDGELNEYWPLTEGIVDMNQMRAIAPFVNLGGAVFRAQVLGHFAASGVSTQTEVVVDASGDKPQVIFRRELTNVGRGSLPIQLTQTNSGDSLISVSRSSIPLH